MLECHRVPFVQGSWLCFCSLQACAQCCLVPEEDLLHRAESQEKAKTKKKGLLEHDAFVSYSEMDSIWVEMHLVLELEQSEPQLKLCLHKRDFVAGGLIQDNIMDAIEKSHKMLYSSSSLIAGGLYFKASLTRSTLL